jgi:hypothetical protein
MNVGFDTWKDVLEVLIIPVAIFAIGALLPSLFDAVKARKFLALIKRELEEMEPWPKKVREGAKWTDHLDKRFIHEKIVENVSDNRDFILSLPPDIAYNLSQLWAHFDKVTDPKASVTNDDLAKHGAFWCDYLRETCMFFDRRRGRNFQGRVYLPWVRLVLEYHPELSKSGRLFMEDRK